MLSVILGAILVIMTCVIVWLVVAYIRLYNEFYEQKDLYFHYKNKISMIEYHLRKYKEGENAYTVLRRITDVIHNFYRQ